MGTSLGALRKQEALIGAAPEREHVRMLEQQQRVADFVKLARRDHRGLQRERRLILDDAEIRDAQYAGVPSSTSSIIC